MLAFLPQFTDAARGPVRQQILILGAVFTAAAVFGLLALRLIWE